MKKILLSVATIAVVGAIAVSATSAYFSDTESNTGNTFTAGTIAISLAGNDSWSTGYQMPNLMPGESGNVNLRVTNTGTNPESVTKKLYDFVQTGTLDSYKIQDKVLYTLAVEVYKADNTKIWWQTIYSGVPLTSVYHDGLSVDLGTIPTGGYMLINQNYKLDENTGNEYQNHGFSFKMDITGNQLSGANGLDTITLENKGVGPEYAIIADGVQGTFSYQTTGSTLNYTFTGTVKTAGTYTLVYPGTTGDYPGVGSKFLGQVVSIGTSVTMSGSVDTGSIANGKIWLVPASTYNGGLASDGTFGGWDNVNNLTETALINYTKN